MALRYKWSMDVGIHGWTVQVRVYDKSTEFSKPLQAMGIPRSQTWRINSTCVLPFKLRKGQKRVAHIFFALDTVCARTIVHEMQHLALFIYKMDGNSLYPGFSETKKGCADEEILCDIMAWLTVIFMWGWRKHVDKVKGEPLPATRGE